MVKLHKTMSPCRSLFPPALLFTLPLIVGLCLSFPVQGQEAIREEVKKTVPKLTKPPRLLRFMPAEYPPAARAKGIQGTVQLLITIDNAGRVSQVEIQKAPDPSLAQAAQAAAKQFLFSPAEVDGKPAPVRIQYAYNFVLEMTFKPRLPTWMEGKKVRRAIGSDVLVGRVREQGTRLSVPGAAVAIPALGLEVKADKRGRFKMAQVPPGKYRVKAISPEHKRETITVDIRTGEQTQIEFYLPRLIENPYETVVRGTRRKTVVTRISLKEKELTTVPGTFGDPIRVIENLPGVARMPYIGGALLIRGASPEDSGVFLDGIKIPILYHFLGGPSVLHPDFLNRIDYYPGNVDVRYGRLIAGVVDVSTRNAFSEQWGGSLDINLLNTSALLKIPVHKKVSLSAAVRRSYIDAILPTILKATDRSATTVVPIYYDYQLRLDVDLAGDDQLFFLVFGSDDSLDVATNDPESVTNVTLDSRISFHRLLARWRKQIRNNLVSIMTPSVGIDYLKFDMGTAKVDLKILDVALREDLEWRLFPKVTLRAGLDLDIQKGEFDAEIPILADYRNPGSGRLNLFTDNPQPVTISQVQLGLGGYIDSILQLTPRLQLIPGTRFELFYYVDQPRYAIDPRLTARFTLGPKTTLKGAVGLFSQAPQQGPQLMKELGNPDLLLEHAAHFSGGLEQQLLAALHLDAQLFYIRRYDLIVPTEETRIIDGTVRPLRYTNQGNGYSYGLEVMLKHDVTRRFYGWLAYTLSQTKVQQEPNGEYVNFTFDQTHILTLVGSVRLGSGWEIGSRFRLVSGRPDTPVLGGIFDSDRNRYFQIQGDVGSTRLPLFHQLDLRVEKTWFFNAWRLSTYLDIQNIYNAENPEATLYDYRFKDSAPLRGLPLLPTLGIRGSF